MTRKYFPVKASHLVKFSGNQNHTCRVLTTGWRFLTDISLFGTSPIQSPKRLTLKTIQGHSLYSLKYGLTINTQEDAPKNYS